MRKNIIITGNPRSGKSTLLSNIVSTVHQKVGFFTHELRESGERIGFEIETHDGEKVVLASTKLQTDFKVSKYFVAPNNLDTIIHHVESFTSDDLLFLDEIGQMELFSESFKLLALNYLNSSNTCVATLSKVFRDDFTEQIRTRDDVILVELSEKNRDQQQVLVRALLNKIEKARKYIKEPERFTVAEDIVRLTPTHAERTLKKVHWGWECDCDFFSEHQICSHTIALDEYLKNTQA